MNWQETDILYNSTQSWLRFAIILAAGILFSRLIARLANSLLFRLIKRYSAEENARNFQIFLSRPAAWLIFYISFLLACDELKIPAEWNLKPADQFGLLMIVERLSEFILLLLITWSLLRVVDYFAFILKQRSKQTLSTTDDQLIPFIKEGLKILVIIFAFFITLGIIFEVNVASLIAGLGIGGLAFALAAQDTLQNLLGSVAIFIDKPFVLGDLIRVGPGVLGRVEKIGFRTTRIRTLENSVMIIPNKKMIDAELENLSMRQMIRALYTLTLRVNTPADRITAFIEDQRRILSINADIHRDFQVRVERMSDIGIEITLNYYVLTSELNKFQEEREKIMMETLLWATKNELEFAMRPFNL